MKSKVKDLYSKFMMVVGALGSLVFYLQAFEIFHKKSAGSVSLFAFSVGLTSVISWLIYGIIIKDKVLLVSNIFATIGASAVVIGILIYS